MHLLMLMHFDIACAGPTRTQALSTVARPQSPFLYPFPIFIPTPFQFTCLITQLQVLLKGTSRILAWRLASSTAVWQFASYSGPPANGLRPSSFLVYTLVLRFVCLLHVRPFCNSPIPVHLDCACKMRTNIQTHMSYHSMQHMVQCFRIHQLAVEQPSAVPAAR